MIYNRELGYAPQAVKQGAPERERDVSGINAAKAICLNCKKKKCNGCSSKEELFRTRRNRR